ncbi:MAG: SDR family NAD(P)-dependent oxidoreductase [Halieaceae bacterium]|nr:SDR family NAD(P)-dependent oxidoreductase [Halieaceae bacterium]
MDTNVTGVYRVARAFARMLIDRDLGGSIVNLGSIGGLRIGVGQTAYGASKAAVIHLTRGLSQELASKNIRVNALCPGFFVTEMNHDYFASEHGQAYIKNTPAGRTGRLEELNGPLLLLVSDAGSFVNGVALPVDGSHSNKFD